MLQRTGFVDDGVEMSGRREVLSLAQGPNSGLSTPRAQRCRGLE